MMLEGFLIHSMTLSWYPYTTWLVCIVKCEIKNGHLGVKGCVLYECLRARRYSHHARARVCVKKELSEYNTGRS